MFEQLIGEQMTVGFDSYFYENSSVYRKKYSCEITSIFLVEEWKKALDSNLNLSILSTDMSKAFDSLHLLLLLSKLEAYGFEDEIINLLKSYLCNRINRVKIGNKISFTRIVNRGCHQGSSLGPLLWNIFQNDLSYCVKPNLSMYADDHQIYHPGPDLFTVKPKLTKSAENATRWYDTYLLPGNVKKYQIMNIRPRCQDEMKIMYIKSM